jgi:hypothetical protein
MYFDRETVAFLRGTLEQATRRGARASRSVLGERILKLPRRASGTLLAFVRLRDCPTMEMAS